MALERIDLLVTIAFTCAPTQQLRHTHCSPRIVQATDPWSPLSILVEPHPPLPQMPRAESRGAGCACARASNGRVELVINMLAHDFMVFISIPWNWCARQVGRGC